jgi:hypothetical protein
MRAGMTTLKTYQSHKIVEAGRHTGVIDRDSSTGKYLVQLQDDEGSPPYTVELEYEALLRYTPKPGDYVVRYADGYLSVSPAKAFEEGYRELKAGEPQVFGEPAKPEGLCFGSAIDWLKSGARVARAGWNGKGMWLDLQRPDEHSKMTLPYIFMKTVQGDNVPWLASQTDMLAEDWYVIERT